MFLRFIDAVRRRPKSNALPYPAFLALLIIFLWFLGIFLEILNHFI
jgi:hypothetical protein